MSPNPTNLTVSFTSFTFPFQRRAERSSLNIERRKISRSNLVGNGLAFLGEPPNSQKVYTRVHVMRI